MGRIKARTAIKRYSKCGYAPILLGQAPVSSGQVVLVETFEIFTYICSDRQLSNNLFQQFLLRRNVGSNFESSYNSIKKFIKIHINRLLYENQVIDFFFTCADFSKL
jgi:hypothetical protein